MSGEFAGRLKERITIERPSAQREASGLQLDVWTRLFACWAAIAASGAGGQVQGQALSAMPRFVVTIRRRGGVAVGQRIRWGERVLIVLELTDEPLAKERLTMRCEEVRA